MLASPNHRLNLNSHKSLGSYLTIINQDDVLSDFLKCIIRLKIEYYIYTSLPHY